MTTHALFCEDAYLTDALRGDGHGHRRAGYPYLNQTVFYPLGGGQAGDAGTLTLADGTRIEIADTRKAKLEGATPDDAVHVPVHGQEDALSKLNVGDKVKDEIDCRRMRLPAI